MPPLVLLEKVDTYMFLQYYAEYSTGLVYGFKEMPKKKKDKESEVVRLSAIDEDILTVLMNRELYGLEILDELNPGRPISLSFGSLYPALNRLEAKGLVSWRWGDEQEDSGGARRKYYKVTSLGASALSEIQEYRAMLAMRAAQGQTALGGA